MRWMVALIWRLPPRSRRWRLVLPELTGIGATPAARASLASLEKRLGAGDLADELGRGQGSEAGLGEQLRRDRGDEPGDLSLERLDGLGELADAAQLVARDADAHRLLRPREPTRDPRRPAAVEQRTARQLQFGPEVVQMPLQRVVERDALADQPLAMVDEQPQIELGAFQLRGRQRIQAFAQRRPGDRDRVDAVGLPAPASAADATSAISFVVTRRTRSPRPIRNRSKDPETCRQSSIAQTRSPPSSRAQTSSAAKPLAPTWTVCSPTNSPVAAETAAIVCERL